MTPERIAEFTALADRCLSIARAKPQPAHREPTAQLGDRMARQTAQTQVFTRANAKAVWNDAVAQAKVKCRGNVKAAVAQVMVEQPGLREAMVAAANADRQAKPTSAKAVARASKPQAMTKQAFDERLAQLMDDGMSKRDAAMMLSKSMGLSQSSADPSFWQSGKERYR